MTFLTNTSFKDRDIEDERFELTAKDALYFLGPNLTLRRCHVILRVSARRLITSGVHFIDCTVEAKQELKNFPWYMNATFTGCQFKGRYWGNSFGRWPNGRWEGDIEHCDFTEAHVDACRFMGCDASTLRFPRWPYFTLLDTHSRSQALKAVQWPGKVHLAVGGFEQDPPTTVATTFFATRLAQEFNVTEESIKAVAERLDGVIL